MGRVKFSWHKNWKAQGIPLRENCDATDPRQVFLWCFTGFAAKGAPLMLPVEFWEALSEHLVECLGLPVEESIERIDGKKQKVRRLVPPLPFGEPRRKYFPPATVMNRGVANGEWVTMDTPDPVRTPVSQQLAALSHVDQVAIKDAIVEKLGLPANEPEPHQMSVGQVAKRLGLKGSQVVTVLQGWGLEKATTRTVLDRATALRIVAHYNRARGYDIA